MDSISYTYEVERRDTCNFHGWVVFECSEYLEEEIFSSELRSEAEAILRDYRGA